MIVDITEMSGGPDLDPCSKEMNKNNNNNNWRNYSL